MADVYKPMPWYPPYVASVGYQPVNYSQRPAAVTPVTPNAHSVNDARAEQLALRRAATPVATPTPVTAPAPAPTAAAPVAASVPVAPAATYTTASSGVPSSPITSHWNAPQATNRITPTSDRVVTLPSRGVDTGDIVAAGQNFAKQYATALANGQTPVLSRFQQAAMDRLFARMGTAGAAANAVHDQQAQQTMLNDPNLMLKASQVAKEQGISESLALKYVLTQNAMSNGDYRLANNFYMRDVVPQMDTEQERAVAIGLSTGAHTPTMRNPIGAEFGANGTSSVYQNDDGTTTVVAGGHTVTGTPAQTLGVAQLSRAANPVQATANSAYQQTMGTAANAQAAASSARSVAAASDKARNDTIKAIGDNLYKQGQALRDAYKADNGVSPTNSARAAENELRRAKMLLDAAANEADPITQSEMRNEAYGIMRGAQ